MRLKHTLEFTQEMKIEAADEADAKRKALETCHDIPFDNFWDDVRPTKEEVAYTEELRDVDNNE